MLNVDSIPCINYNITSILVGVHINHHVSRINTPNVPYGLSENKLVSNCISPNSSLRYRWDGKLAIPSEPIYSLLF